MTAFTDFRPDYTKLGILKHHFPSVPVLAVTATASERVRHDCAQILRLDRNYRFFRSTANRPNLNYSVRIKPDSKDALIDDMVDFIKANHFEEAGIIYTFSKKEADDVANRLCDNGIVARSYHSDVHETTKDQVQRSWMRNETQVVVATIAFGLVSCCVALSTLEIALGGSLILTHALIRESINPTSGLCYIIVYRRVSRRIIRNRGEQEEMAILQIVSYITLPKMYLRCCP